MSRIYNYPVWGTQGGGLVRMVGRTYIFVDKPDVPGLDVGDEMPSEWGLIPANEEARQSDEFNEGVGEFFELAFDAFKNGDLDTDQVEGLFPSSVHQRNHN